MPGVQAILPIAQVVAAVNGRGCVLPTLEGPGITTSRCPTCHQPGWKNQLLPDRRLAHLVTITRGLLEQGARNLAASIAPCATRTPADALCMLGAGGLPAARTDAAEQSARQERSSRSSMK